MSEVRVKPRPKSTRNFLNIFKRRAIKHAENAEVAPAKSKLSILEILASFITLFLSVSTIHGFAHWTAEKRHPVEIFIWLSLVCTAIYGAVVLSHATWDRYQTNPTVISMERDRYSWNTSFPSATICPIYKVNDEFVDKYLAKSPEQNKTMLKEFLVSLFEANYKSFHKVVPYDGIPSEDFMKLVLDLEYNFAPAVSNSGTHGYKYSLVKVMTEMGICYTFNSNLAIYNSAGYWHSNSWMLYPENATFNIHPLDGEVFANVVNMSTGFNFYLHGPHEVVDAASKEIYSPDGHFLQIYLSSLTIFTSKNAKALSVPQRKCRFYDESNLKRSPVYSYILCRTECRAELSKKLCGCVPHFYRKLDGERVCDVKGLHCLAKHSQRLITLKRECSCFSNCDEIHFSIEDIDTREWFLGSNLQWGLKEYPKMRLRRDVIFGFTDVLVSIGGMAGLFLGCSVLSFIEIIYFFTIRLFWFVAKYGKDTRDMITTTD